MVRCRSCVDLVFLFFKILDLWPLKFINHSGPHLKGMIRFGSDKFVFKISFNYFKLVRVLTEPIGRSSFSLGQPSK